MRRRLQGVNGFVHDCVNWDEMRELAAYFFNDASEHFGSFFLSFSFLHTLYTQQLIFRRNI